MINSIKQSWVHLHKVANSIINILSQQRPFVRDWSPNYIINMTAKVFRFIGFYRFVNQVANTRTGSLNQNRHFVATYQIHTGRLERNLSGPYRSSLVASVWRNKCFKPEFSSKLSPLKQSDSRAQGTDRLQVQYKCFKVFVFETNKFCHRLTSK